MNFAQVWKALQQELQTAREHLFQRSRSRGRKRLSLELLEDRTVLTAWVPIGPAPITNGETAGNLPVSGRITGIAVDPNNDNIVFVAAADGGVWKTTNATYASPSWTPLTDNLTDAGGNPIPEFMGAVALADATSGPYRGQQIVYAGTGEANNSGDSFSGEGILVSTDGGNTWTLTGPPLNAFAGSTVSKIAVDPSDLTGGTAYAAVSRNGNTGIWMTKDFGQTWHNMTGNAGLSTSYEWSDVVVDPCKPSTVYAAQGDFNGAVGNGVYVSYNSGVAWKPLLGTPSGMSVGRISLAIYDDGSTSELLVSAAGAGGSPSKMVRILNGAVTPLSPPDYLGGLGWYNTTLAIDPNNPQYLYAGGTTNNGAVGNIESFNGGLTWQNIRQDVNHHGPHSDDHAVAFSTNGRYLFDGNDGGVFRLNMPSNFNQTPSQLYNQQSWSDLNTNLQLTQFYGIGVSPDGTVYGASQDNGVAKYTGNPSWQGLIAGDGAYARFDPTSNTFYYESNNKLYYGSNSNDITGGVQGNGNGPFVLDSSGYIYYGTDYLNFSSNHGKNWSAIGSPNVYKFNPGKQQIDAIAVSPDDNNVVYVSAGGQLFVTQNAQAGGNAVKWNAYSYPGADSGAGNSLVVDPSDPTGATAFAVSNSSGGARVSMTTDFGAHWTSISGNLPNTPVWSVALSPGGSTIFVGTDVGVYTSIDGGATWGSLGTGLPNAQVREIVDSPTGLYVGTHGRGAWEFNGIGATVGLTVTNPPVTNGTAYSTTGSPTICGTVNDFSGLGIASVRLSIDGNIPVAATVTGSTWSYGASGLGDGFHTVSVTATDNAGDSTNVRFELNVETAAPVLTVVAPKMTNDVAYSNSASVAFGGNAVAADGSHVASVTVSIDGGAPIATTLDPYGTDFATTVDGLLDGTHTVAVVATDRAGNSTTDHFTLVVDTVAPTVTVTSPTLSGGIGYSNTGSPTIAGTVNDGTKGSGIASVNLIIDGHASVPATVTGGTWSYTASGLLDGNHTITVTATDKVGNTRILPPFTLQVDTVGPSVTVTSPIANSAGIAYSKTGTATISGTVNPGNNTSGISCVALTIDSAPPVLATLTGNNWSYTAPGLSDGPHTISVVATDMLGNVGPASKFTLQVDTVAPTVTVTTPTITNGTATVYNNVPLSFAGLVTDPNPSSGIASVMLSIDGNTPFAATINGANWSYSNAVASIGNHSVCVTATDNAGNATSYTFALTIKNNSPLGLTIPPGPLTYNAQGTPINVAAGATVVDGASNFHGGTLTVGIAGGADPNDQITVYNQGTGPGLFNVVGNAVYYGVSTFSQIGTFSGGTGGAPFVFYFTTFAYTNVDASVAQALLRDLQFSNSSATPSAAQRTLQFQLIDGSHNSSGLVDVAVNVIAPHAAPTIQLNTSGISYTPQSPPQLLAPTGSVTAGTATNFSGGSLVVCYDAGATADDCLQVLNVGQISVNTGCVFYGTNQIGTISGGTGGTPLVISLTTFADATATGALIRAIAFQNGSPAPSTTPRTVQFQLDDGSGGVSAPVTETVKFAAPPVSITPAASSLSYTLGNPPVALLPQATFSDSAAFTLAGSRLIVYSNQSADRVTIRNVGGIQVAYSSFTGTTNVTYFGVMIGAIQGNAIHFTSNATSASIQALLRAYAFSTTGPTGSRTVSFNFTDGYGNTAGATVTVNV